MPPKRRPWYSFLYILFGAQGSFFLWLAALGGVYWTYENAVLWAFNPEPADVEVSEAAQLDRGPRRWVRLHGVEVALDTGATPDAKDAAKGYSILIDPQDPAALRWRELLRARPIDANRGQIEAHVIELRKELDFVVDDEGTRLKRLPADSPYFPRSWIAVVDERGGKPDDRAPLHLAPGPGGEPGAAPAVGGADRRGDAPAPPATPGDDIGGAIRDFLEKQARRMDVVRRSVRPDVDPSGLLKPTSPSVTVRIEPYGFASGPYALHAGERPSGWKAGLFAAFGVTLFFLLVGLRGLGHRDEAPAAASPPSVPDRAPGQPPRAGAPGAPGDASA